LIQIMAARALAAEEVGPQLRGTAMTSPLSGKAEIVLDYPDKVLIGTFGQADQCHARFDANDVLLTLQRSDDSGACRFMGLKLEPQVLADILSELAASVSSTAAPKANRAVLREAADALARALASVESTEELTPDEEVLLLHVLE
jgi:hypothetical protein